MRKRNQQCVTLCSFRRLTGERYKGLWGLTRELLFCFIFPLFSFFPFVSFAFMSCKLSRQNKCSFPNDFFKKKKKKQHIVCQSALRVHCNFLDKLLDTAPFPGAKCKQTWPTETRKKPVGRLVIPVFVVFKSLYGRSVLSCKSYIT